MYALVSVISLSLSLSLSLPLPLSLPLQMKVVGGHSSSGSDIKSTSSPSSAWVTRYHPGVLLLKGDSVRDCQVQRQLFEREDEFCERTKLT